VKRREFITLVGGAAAWPITARAQQSSRVKRVGILMPYPKGDAEYGARVQAFQQELEKLGWVHGTVQFDERWTADNMDVVRAEAASLIASNPDAVLATGGRVIPILIQLSHSIPIVIPGNTDPVGVGWVTNLAHPGGNLTGFTLFELSILSKSLELLRQIAPSIVRVALIYNPDNPNTAIYRRIFESGASPLAIKPIAMPIHHLAEIDHAVAALSDRQTAGALFPPDVTTTALRSDIVALLAHHRVPAIYSDRVFTKIGGLASYGPDRTDLFRRSASILTAFYEAKKQVTYRSSNRQNTSSWSTLERPKGSGLNYHLRCSRLPTR